MTCDMHDSSVPATNSDRSAQRAVLFRETTLERLERWTLGAAWALQPKRIGDLPALAAMHLDNLTAAARPLPEPEEALRPSGLCGLAHDLSVPTLIEAHRKGLYPFAHLGSLKWMSPPQRCVLSFENTHLAKRLRSRLRQARHRVTFDTAFERVIKACAARRPGKWRLTWITPRIMDAYAALHDAGYAHSFEVWDQAGELVGGGYGVAVGGAFTIESQFTIESHASKVGFAVLNWHLAQWGFLLSDNKGATKNTLDAGFQLMSRGHFLRMMREAAAQADRRGRWSVETDLQTVAAWDPAKTYQRSSIIAAPQAATEGRVAPASGAVLVPTISGNAGRTPQSC